LLRRRSGDDSFVLTLFQAEWCPYSHLVRQRLTELGLPFVALQVEPRPEDRDELREASGDDSIPVLVTDEGEAIRGAAPIIDWLDAHYAEPETARGHRAQARAHSSLPR
jgi:glutathione S-transferase